MKNLASYIDHTILKPEATSQDIQRVCLEAVQYQFASVCVNPYYVRQVSELLKDSPVKVTSVIGFPLGCTLKEVKAFEARMAVNAGADELDMVINIGALKSKDYQTVLEDIKAVVDAAEGCTVKVIIEACLLTDDEKVKACQLAVEAGANFVKTSTGFSKGGAEAKDIALMKKAVGNQAKVKASGGIKNYQITMEMIEAGAERIGASSSIDIVEGAEASQKK
ncbi:MAG: deoxyribose-phosphate aldolase [Tissierellales bacterium]|nr:deoxyribose-phosphate aldolase [Tissierellales bacterium]MBN2828177.1 deoxyribose-phosphate aldolase [Tissierellales bacterium]